MNKCVLNPSLLKYAAFGHENQNKTPTTNEPVSFRVKWISGTNCDSDKWNWKLEIQDGDVKPEVSVYNKLDVMLTWISVW